MEFSDSFVPIQFLSENKWVKSSCDKHMSYKIGHICDWWFSDGLFLMRYAITGLRYSVHKRFLKRSTHWDQKLYYIIITI